MKQKQTKTQKEYKRSTARTTCKWDTLCTIFSCFLYNCMRMFWFVRLTFSILINLWVCVLCLLYFHFWFDKGPKKCEIANVIYHKQGTPLLSHKVYLKSCKCEMYTVLCGLVLCVNYILFCFGEGPENVDIYNVIYRSNTPKHFDRLQFLTVQGQGVDWGSSLRATHTSYK